MAEYSRGGLTGRLRDWRARRAQARAAARWSRPPEAEPESQPADDPLAARWVPDSERPEAGVAADPDTALSEPSRWLTAGTAAAASGDGAATVLAPSTASATAWLPADVRTKERASDDRGDSSRWVPAPGTEPDEPAEEVDQRRQAAEAYCGVLCEAGAVGAAVDEALDAADDSDAGLLRATRTVAADHAAPVAAPTTWRERLAAEHEHPCSATHHRLAERANGTLGSREERALEEHLQTCEQCREAAERERLAAAAFLAVLPAAIEDERQDAASADGDSADADADAEVARWAAPAAVAAPTVPAATAAPTAPPAAATMTLATIPPAAEVGVVPPPLRRHAPVALLIGAACLAAVIAAAAVVLINSSATKHHVPATNTQAAVHTQAAPPASTAKRSKPKATRHRKPAVHHKAVHKAATHKVTTHKTATTSASTPATTTPATTNTPAATTPQTYTSSAPAQQSQSPTSVSSVSQSSLPADSAPQQGVGSGK